MSISWRLVKKSYIIATQWKSWYRTMDHNVNIQLLPLKYLYNHKLIDYSSAQLSRSVASDSLRHLGPQHTRPPCPSPSPGICPSSCPLHSWCHPAISFSDVFSFCPQSFPALQTFPMSWLFTSDDQNIGASASASVFPMNIQGWFPLRLTGLISLLSKGLSGVFSSTTVRRHQFFGILTSLQSSSHNHTWPLGRPWPRLYGPSSAE